jgi:ABC-2 type transport system ATP-binding protein
MQEAQDLCSRVAVINNGKIAAIDTPMNLRRTFEKRQSVVMNLSELIPRDSILALPNVEEVHISGLTIRCYSPDPGSVMMGLVELAKSQGIKVRSACTESAALEDVFLELIRPRRETA